MFNDIHKIKSLMYFSIKLATSELMTVLWCDRIKPRIAIARTPEQCNCSPIDYLE